MDYRKLNTQTHKETSFLPAIQEQLTGLYGSRFFSVLDLNQRYYQIPLGESSKLLTGFSLDGRYYEFNRLPFGLCNAPHSFHATMQHLIGNIENVRIYLDDIFIYSAEFAEHVVTIKEIITTLFENGVSINFKKSEFAKDSVEFLGHRVDTEGVSPIINKIYFYKSYKPKTRKQAMRLLALFNWFRPFLYKGSERTGPFPETLKNSEHFI